MRLHKKLAVFSFAVIAGLGGFLSLIKYQRVIAEAVFAGRNQVTAALTGVTLNNGSANVVHGNDVTSQTTALSPDTGAYKWTKNSANYMTLNIPFNSGAPQTDFSGNGNNGTAFGTPTFTTSGCKVGSCISFDGVDDYVISSAVTPPGASNFTWEVWVKTAEADLDSHTIMNSWNGDGGADAIMLSVGANGFGCGVAGKATFHFRDASTVFCINGTSIINDNNWHHIVGVREGVNARLYVDGLLETTIATLSTRDFSPSGGVTLGAAHYFWQTASILDEAKIYSVALTAAQISHNHTEGRGSSQNASDGVGGPTIIQSEETAADQLWDLSITPITADGTVGTLLASSNPVLIVSVASNISGSLDSPDEGSPIISLLTIPEGSTAGYRWVKNNVNFTALNMPFNSGASQTDVSGNGNTGSMVNGPTYTSANCKVGGCLVLNGTNAYINAGSGSTTQIGGTNASFSLESWVKRSADGHADIMISQGAAATNVSLHFGYRSTNQFTLAFYANDLNTSVLSDAGAWHHWVGTYDGITNARKLYRDGVLAASDVAPADYTGTGAFLIGTYLPGSSYFGGSLDEVRVYRTVLSSVQVAQHYEDGLGTGQNETDGVGGPTRISAQQHAFGETWELRAREFLSGGSIGPELYVDRATITAAAATTVTPVAPSGTQDRDITIDYTCSNADNTGRDLLVEYSTNGGGTYASATIASTTSGTITGSYIFAATCNGSLQSLVWDSLTDLVATGALDSDVRIRLTVQLAAAPSGDTGNFSVQNPFVLSSPTTINSGDLTYEDGDVTCSGTTLTINGSHSFASLELLNGCTLTHSANTTLQTNFAVLTISGDVTIDATSSINLNGKGFQGGQTRCAAGYGPGAGQPGTAPSSSGYPSSGASYGGRGGTGNVSNVAASYGSLVEPVDLGSGGAAGTEYSCDQGTTTGGAGGGAIKIVGTGTIILDGTISANGAIGTSLGGGTGTGAAGGGSGGSVWLDFATITGSGAISANGANATSSGGGSGGGGRIAVYYNTNTHSDLTGSVFAAGGATTNAGSAGTIYLKPNADNFGDLVMTNSGAASQYTTLFSGVTQFDTITILNAANVVYTPATLEFDETITIGGSTTTRFALSGTTVSSTTGTAAIVINSNGILSHDLNTTARTNYIDIAGLQDLTVNSGGSINVDGRGYRGGTTRCQAGAGPGAGQPGTDPGSGNFFHSGGASHGGRGGTGNNSNVAASYDDPLEPIDLGSGGAGGGEYLCDQGTTTGGAGGGAIKIVGTGTITLDGTISANGAVGTSLGGGSGTGAAGGGAGGSVWLDFATVAGSGAVSANGANATSSGGGSGGGGRVALYYTTNSHASLTTSTTARGGSLANAGGAGTIYFKSSGDNFGDVQFSNGGTVGQYATLFTGATQFDLLTVLDGANVTYQPTTLEVDELITIGGTTTTTFAVSDTSISSTTGIADIVINNNGVLSHDTNTTTQVNDLDVSGFRHATINSGGSINVLGKGYAGGGRCASGSGPGGGRVGTDPGSGNSFPSGGGIYGGRGGNGNNVNFTTFYGSITAPADLGSGGAGGGDYLCDGGVTTGGAGGGAVKLVLSGTLTLNGAINANGAVGTSTVGQAGGGSGGSVWLDADTIAGSGTITADGGNPSSSGGGAGGGGRIAIYYNTNSHTGLISSISVAGGSVSNYGSSGTAFVKQNSLSAGDLKLDSNNLSSAHSTNLFVTGQPSTYTFRDLYVIEQAKLLIDSPCSGTPALTVTGSTYLTSGGTITNNQAVTCTVLQAAIDVTIAILPGGIIDSAYNDQIPSTGGYAPHTFVCRDGGLTVDCATVLPPGLAMSSAGVISGTPTTYGIYTFTVRATEASPGVGTDDQALSISVGNAPTAPTTLFVHSTDAQLGNGSPTGIDLSPVFSAIYNDPDTAETATDYELIVDDNSDFSSPLWSSGTLALGVACDQGFRCANINYAGSALSNATTYYWKIRFVDELGLTGAFSATNSFTTNEVPSAPVNLFSDDANAQTGATNPVGVLATHPVFSAEFVDPDATDTATQAQVQVSENDDLTSPVWDSGTINIASCDQGTRCADIVYAGTVLVAETTYYWRIRFTDAAGSVSPWSEDPVSTNTFTMGSRGGSSTQFRLNQPPAPTAPAAPLAGATEVLGSTSVRYNWIDLSNNETGFRVLNAEGQIVAQAEAGQTSAVETALAPNTVISGRRVLAFNAVGQSASVELPQATTAAQVSRPVLDSRTGDSVRFIVEPAFTTFPGETAVRFELLVTSPAIGLSQPVTRTVTSEWIQQNDYTFTGISHDDVVQVRVITRNQEGLQNEPGIYEDVAELSRRFVVTMGVFKKGTEALPRPMATTDIISVRLALESVGTDPASSVILNLPLPQYIKYRPGTMIVDARAGLDTPNDGSVGNQNGVSASWSTVNPGDRHTLSFELAFDEEDLRALKLTSVEANETIISRVQDVLAAANPLINLQASVSFADSDVVYMSPVVTLEPDVASIPDELVPLETEEEIVPEESPVPTPEQVVIIEEILKQEFGVTPQAPLPSQPQPTTSPTPSSPSPLQTGNTSVSSDNGSFNVGVTNEYNLLGLTGAATVSADMITFAGTTTEPFTVVTLIFNGTVTVIAVSDAKGVWQTFVNAEKLGIAPGQESVVTVEAIAAKGDLRSERVQVANVTVSRGGSGELTADFETIVSGNTTLTAIREVQKEFVRVIEAQQPAIQTTLSVAAPIVVVSSVPLWGYLPYVPTMIYHFITYLLGLIGRKKRDKQRFYGVVYDSISKQILPLAIVRIYSSVIPTGGQAGAEGSYPSQQKLVSTVVTDKLGRYESLLPPGNYRLEVSKPQYQFPSQIVTTDLDANFHTYKTQEGMNIGKSGTEITVPDVPLDPVNAQRQWQLTGGLKKVWLAVQKVGNYFVVPVLLVGSIASVATVAAIPDKGLNWGLAIMYVLLLAAQLRLRPKLMKPWGVVYDIATNAVLPLTTIQLIDPQYGKVVTSRLSDYEGRFSFLPEPGSYVLKATRAGYEHIEVVETPSSERQPMSNRVMIEKADQAITGDVAMRITST